MPEIPSHPYDAFLASLALRPSLFDLSSMVHPGSIRDQIIRASLFVDRAMESGYVGGKTPCRVLVIGAGVAGVTVIMRLAGMSGVTATLVDPASQILSRQARCGHRFVSPSVYDWPASHYDQRTFEGIRPGIAPKLPRYREGTPSRGFVKDWQVAFHSVSSKVHYKQAWAYILNNVSGPPWKTLPWFVRFREDKGETNDFSSVEEFDVVVCCRGFGRERSLPVFNEDGKSTGAEISPFGFWESDPYPRPGTIKRFDFSGPVAVIGGGDGAIQDALRFLTNGAHCRTIMEELHPILERHMRVAREFHSLQCEEENAQRARAADPSSESALQTQLQVSCERVIRAIYDTNKAALAAEALLARSIVPDAHVCLFYSARTLGPCFGLNRFLAMLFNEHIHKHRPGRELLNPEHRVNGIICKDHRSANMAPFDCFNKPHGIRFSRKDQSDFLCRIVIPRIGLDLKSPLDSFRREGSLHQALPWYFTYWGPLTSAILSDL